MFEPHPGGQGMDPLNLVFPPLFDIIHNLDDPMIMDVTDGRIAIT